MADSPSVGVMDSHFRKMVDLNIRGRVMVACNGKGVTDMPTIEHYIGVVAQAVDASMGDACTPGEFDALLNEQIYWLEGELDRRREAGDSGLDEAEQRRATPSADHPRPTGYVPEAKSMEERLADQRARMEQLLKEDCVHLQLIDQKEAARLSRSLIGREPEKAEAEVVAELRNRLHQQVRGFFRQHKGGPWENYTSQNELRMDIASTRTIRSLVNLTRQIHLEREEWLKENPQSLAGRLFGGKIKLKN